MHARPMMVLVGGVGRLLSLGREMVAVHPRLGPPSKGGRLRYNAYYTPISNMLLPAHPRV